MTTTYVFPQDEPTGVLSDKFQRQGGLELRDYFAAQVMECFVYDVEDLIEAARQAYAVADAMLAAREEKTNGRKTEGV